jgi:hypothetical protein
VIEAMRVDVEFDDAADAPDPEAGRLGLWTLVKDVVLHPGAAMRRLDAYPGRRWWFPLVLLAVVGVVNALILTPRITAAAMQDIDLAQMQAAGVDMATVSKAGSVAAMGAGVIGALFGVIAGTFLVAAILHFVGTVFGGQQAFNAVLTTTSWARIPLILRGLVQMAWFGTHGGEFDVNIAGLAGLVADAEKPTAGASSFLAPLLALIEVWNLWYLVLLVIAVRATSKVTRGRAILIVGVYVALAIGAGLISTALGRALAGFGGG